MRAALLTALALMFAAAPASADRFLADPTSCHVHPTANGIHHTYVGARFTDCDTGRRVVGDWLHHHPECHKTGYCRVFVGSWSCHTTFSSSSYHTHCQAIGGVAETFTSWKRV